MEAFAFGKSIVPSSKTVFPGRNFKLLGFGVSWIWMKTDRAVKQNKMITGIVIYTFWVN